MQTDALWGLQESNLKTALGFSTALSPKLTVKGLSIADVQQAGSKKIPSSCWFFSEARDDRQAMCFKASPCRLLRRKHSWTLGMAMCSNPIVFQ